MLICLPSTETRKSRAMKFGTDFLQKRFMCTSKPFLSKLNLFLFYLNFSNFRLHFPNYVLSNPFTIKFLSNSIELDKGSQIKCFRISSTKVNFWWFWSILNLIYVNVLLLQLVAMLNSTWNISNSKISKFVTVQRVSVPFGLSGTV